jgi:hypothetical protein
MFNFYFQPNLSVFHLGLVYVMYESVYIITGPMWGLFIDNTKQTRIKYFTLSGCICSILGFIVMGPFLPMNMCEIKLSYMTILNYVFNTFFIISRAFQATCIGLVIFGLGLGATFVSGFVQWIQDAV